MTRTFCLALLVLLPTAFAQSAPDSSRAAWLASRLLVLDSRDAAGAFARSVGEARVVALGEATHGDGAAFALRDSLTRALHRAGFRALALEATGLYDLPADLATPGRALAAVDAVDAAWLWRSSAEALPGLRYAAGTVGAPGELRLAGIDVQHGLEGGARLLDAVEAALGRTGFRDDRWPVVRSTFEAAFANPFTPVEDARQDLARRTVAELLPELGEPDAAVGLGLRSALAHAEVMWQRSMAPRDRQLGANAVALARDRSTVVWAASSHAVRRLPAVDTMDPEWAYDGAVTMGDGLAGAFGEAYRVVAFTACGGAYGAAPIGLDEATIGAPTAGSLEALVCAAPFETAAYLDLRRLAGEDGGAWLSAPLVARPLGYAEMRASWPLVLDGLVVVREMTPSTPSALAGE